MIFEKSLPTVVFHISVAVLFSMKIDGVYAAITGTTDLVNNVLAQGANGVNRACATEAGGYGCNSQFSTSNAAFSGKEYGDQIVQFQVQRQPGQAVSTSDSVIVGSVSNTLEANCAINPLSCSGFNLYTNPAVGTTTVFQIAPSNGVSQNTDVGTNNPGVSGAPGTYTLVDGSNPVNDAITTVSGATGSGGVSLTPTGASTATLGNAVGSVTGAAGAGAGSVGSYGSPTPAVAP